MNKPHYAFEAFPWAGIDESLTVDGLFSHRTTHQRLAWARVLGGSDEQLIDAAVRLGNVSAANNAMTEEEVRAFYLACIRRGMVEAMLVSYWNPVDERLSFFREGLRAA